MEEILKNISVNDLEKLKLLLSIIPGQEQKEVVTLRVFRDEYLNLIKNNRSKAYFVSVNIAMNHLTEFFGIQNSVSAIQLKEVENFLIHLQQKVKKGYRVYYRTLKAAFNKAVDWGYVKENYFHKVKLPKKQQVNPVFINSDQLSAISNQIKNEVIKDFVVFGFYTGMRLNEIVNLTWRNVDLEERIITVGDEKFTTKGRNQRYIPICEEVYEILVKRKREELKGTPSCVLPLKKEGEIFQYVFCKKYGSKYCGNYISRKFRNACIAAGLDPSSKIEKEIHFHSLRHSFASNFAQKGVSLYTIKELLGHSSITTTEIYSHLNMETLREAIGKLDTGCKILDAGEKQNKELIIFRINSGEK
jgi:site-specific recombinase XerD